MVRCKFHCQSKVTTETGIWEGEKYKMGIAYSYRFSVVTSGSEENKQFFASTPSGVLELSTVRGDLFTPGKDYYLDLSEG